jgi:glycosyltransferase involved in cell wall biosynthesis
MNQLISVVIPTFNREKVLKRAIDSVVEQTYDNWELIIVDNNSTDNTNILVHSYKNPKIKLTSVDNDGVIGFSRNVGIRNANGHLVAFLDSDDWWNSTKLEIISNNFDDKTDITYHDCFIVTDSSKRQTNCRILKGDVLSDLIENGNTLVNSSVVAKKKSLYEVGCFSEEKEVVGWEDYHLWLKLAENNCVFHKIKGGLGYCWQGDDNFDSPERVLFNIVQIKKCFYSKYSNYLSIKHAWWTNYAKGKAHMQLGNKTKSRIEFSSLLIRRAPLMYKIKSLYYLLRMVLYV